MGHADVEGSTALSVTVVLSPRAGEVDLIELQMPHGATVADALRKGGLALRHAGIDIASLVVGIWGVPATLNDRLRERDRVEIYRPLQVDPKEARRLRQQKQRHKPTP